MSPGDKPPSNDMIYLNLLSELLSEKLANYSPFDLFIRYT